MKILLIEDEDLAVKKLQKTIAAVDPTIEIVGTADSIKSSVEWLSLHPVPDLILMERISQTFFGKARSKIAKYRNRTDCLFL